MKVLLVNGSPHKEGCTYTALMEAASDPNKNGIETDMFQVGNKPLSGCIACKTCIKKPFLLCLLAAVLLALTACGQQTASQSSAPVVYTQDQEVQQSEQEMDAPEEAALPEEAKPDETESGTLVIYFSATNNTKTVAGTIADTLGADTYEITPAEPYTSGDLNWRDESSRVTAEHEDPDFRPALGGDLPDLEDYDTVFLGYPLWWQEAPNIVRTFLESVDLSGKTVIPFCTSSSSELGESAEHLHDLAPDADWREGQRFPSRADEENVSNWAKGLAR